MRISRNSLFVRWLAIFSDDLKWEVKYAKVIEADLCKLSSWILNASFGSLMLVSAILLFVLVCILVGKTILHLDVVMNAHQVALSLLVGVFCITVFTLTSYCTIKLFGWLGNKLKIKTTLRIVKTKIQNTCIKIDIK